ncbi:MAG: ComF family protein [Tatlockia sp.]|nr:ComF family protein [Tatlockia sp.]
MRQKIASITQKLRLPSVCVLCQLYHSQPVAVCESCVSLFKQIGPCCQYCALPLPEDNFLICGFCCKKKPYFDKTITNLVFEEPLRTLLHDFKYKEALYLRSFFVELMVDAFSKSGLIVEKQCLVPVPLHVKKLKQRGFNQAAELCKLLAKKLGLSYEPKLCKKIIHTEPQVNLELKQRRKNLRQAFQSKPSHYEQIILVDDLMTTGSTANELAKLFKEQGAKRVDLWCCARTI